MAKPPLNVTISGYKSQVTLLPNGDVAIQVYIGFWAGWQKFIVPATEWAQIVAYTESK